MHALRDLRTFFRLGHFLAASFCFPASASSSLAPTNQSIPWSQVGANATAQYSGDGLGVIATPRGAQLRCVLQKLEGEVTAEGLSLNSTVPGARDQLQVAAARLGRDAGQSLVLDKQGAVQVVDAQARYVRPALIEEYGVTADGIRQDFLVTQSPAGPGPLRLHLTLRGARAEVSPDGAQLVLNKSGRKLNYNRLRVTDATGRELAAWFEVAGESKIQPVLRSSSAEGGNPKSKMELAVVVEDAGALYPLRIDPTFSDANWISMGGYPGANSLVWAAVADGSGNLYIGGGFRFVGDVYATNIAKWSGSSWSALGSGIGGTVYALAVSGSDLYAAGTFTTAGGSPATNIAKWDGTNWSALGSGIIGGSFPIVSALAVLGNDLYAGGSFTNAGGNAVNRIAKWDGTSWSPLGSGISGSVSALAVLGSDLYVGGSFGTAGGNSTANIAKWDGSTWSALGSGMNGSVSALAVLGNDLYVGGFYFSTAGGTPATNLAKWNGSSWSALGFGTGSVEALAVSGSDLYVGGAFGTAGGNPARMIAKWNGTNWSGLGSGLGFAGLPEATPTVFALAAFGSNVYAGGYFTTAGGSLASYFARWDGSSWSTPRSGVTANVYALAESGGDLYVGGHFTSVAGRPANRIVKWDGNTWSALGSGLGSNPNDYVYALAVSGSDVYAGGQFTTAGGSQATNIAKWNGTNWSALGDGLNGTPHALAVWGSDLYAGGVFTMAGGSPASRIAKWNGINWSVLGAGISGPAEYPSYGGTVSALAVLGTNLYAGGRFTAAGGSPATNIAKWNGSSWSALREGISGPAATHPYYGGIVLALAVSGTNLYAGGAFTTAGTSSAGNLARWNGGRWNPLGSGVNNQVNALAVLGSNLYAAGYFTMAGGSPASRIAKWDWSSWSAMGSGMDRDVRALSVLGSDLYAGGLFIAAGGKVSPYLAKARIASAAESITASHSSAIIQFSGVVGYEYHVQRTLSLTPPMAWTTLTTNPLSPADDGSLTFTDTTAPPGTAYYRLVQN